MIKVFQATEGIKKILLMIRPKDFESQIIEMIKRLMNGESYTSKFSATQLIPTIYPNVSQ